MKNIFMTLLILSFITACGGRASNPIMAVQYKDDKKSCTTLETEIVFIQQEIQRLIPKTDKTGKNVALGVAGAFLLIPWFFMDMSHAEQEEVNAYRQRYNHLVAIAGDKNCEVDSKLMPTPETKKKEAAEKKDWRKSTVNKKEKTMGFEEKVNSVASEIEKLADLKEKGILSEEEFQLQKTKLLNQ